MYDPDKMGVEPTLKEYAWWEINKGRYLPTIHAAFKNVDIDPSTQWMTMYPNTNPHWFRGPGCSAFYALVSRVETNYAESVGKLKCYPEGVIQLFRVEIRNYELKLLGKVECPQEGINEGEYQ